MPHRAPESVRACALASEAGWIPVEKQALRTRHANVFAIGDVATITLTNRKPLPQTGVFAHAEAARGRTDDRNRARRWRRGVFDGEGDCWVALGGGRAAFAVGDFYAEPDPTIALRRPGPVAP